MTDSLEIISSSPEATAAFGKRLGELCFRDIVIALYGDLGSGKTAFVQGLAIGIAVPAEYYVTSPSYTIVCEYPGRMPLYHLDLYRVGDVSEFEDIGLYDILDREGVVAVEWAEKLEDELPDHHLALTFQIIDDSTRNMVLQGHGREASNLIERLKKEKIIISAI